MRDLILDFKRGGASVPEVVHGIVRIWGTEVRPNGPSVVVTTETTLKLSDGKATLANAQTSGTGPVYQWAYIIQVEPFHGRNYRFYVAIPDGATPINLVDLPKLNPITGEGFYLDIEEWEALYGALPSRVDALETSQATQDGKITTLEARPNGNATMRVDTRAGEAIYITDGTTERLLKYNSGWRALVRWDRTGAVTYGTMPTGMEAQIGNGDGGVFIKRTDARVACSIVAARITGLTAEFMSPEGFRGTGTGLPYPTTTAPATDVNTPTNVNVEVGATVIRLWAPVAGVYLPKSVTLYGSEFSWETDQAIPTTNPGQPK